MSLVTITSHRLVKSEDLNHHGTLFAGRASEWIIESGFICVASQLPPNNIVCYKVDGLNFFHPIRLGTVLRIDASIVYAGSTSLMVNVRVTSTKDPNRVICEAFMIFVHVNEDTQPTPHGLKVDPETEQEKELCRRAKEIYNKSKGA